MGPPSNSLDSYWMGFTPNRRFKKAPKLLASASGLYYRSHDGREVLDGTSGLWCCNIGHCHPKVIDAIQRQAAVLDYAPAFNASHPAAFAFADRLGQITPDGLDRLCFTNSGSEAVETALKIALAYHRHRGEGTRTRLIGRARGYHGVNFGGVAVGGIVGNRKHFGALLGGVDHLPHTHDLEANAFSRGQPERGAHLADALEELVALHDASTIAAVIVEPVAASTGVLVPPKGYLERLRAICDRHGILLIFDEVCTGFGRTGAPFAAHSFGVTPDIMTMAKGITSGTVPMGAVAVKTDIHDAFMTGPEHLIELPHGYTYSAHPLAVAAGQATLRVYEEEGLFARAAQMAPYWQEAVHALEGAPHVIDIRTCGLMAGIELAAREGAPTRRGLDVFDACFDAGVLVRTTGDTVALSPPLIIGEPHIDRLVGTLRDVLNTVA